MGHSVFFIVLFSQTTKTNSNNGRCRSFPIVELLLGSGLDHAECSKMPDNFQATSSFAVTTETGTK